MAEYIQYLSNGILGYLLLPVTSIIACMHDKLPNAYQHPSDWIELYINARVWNILNTKA